jgi:aspartate racemase
VKAGVAVAREGRPGETILAAYLVPASDHGIDVEELRTFLERQLPAYMVPSSYSILDALPMTPNKKVDRRALPAPSLIRREAAKPSDEVEARVLAIWKEMLALDSLGTKDNFYSVGGHSLMAIRLVDRLNTELGRELSVNEFFAHPTVEGVSSLLRSAAAAAPAVELVERPMIRSVPSTASAIGAHSGLFCIQGGEPGGVPLFLVHGDKANALLLPKLGPAQEIWGYHHQGSNGERIQFPTVESLARHAHGEWIRTHGDRPCVVAGHSFGALVAYQIAVLRSEQGLETPRTLIIDARHPSVLGGRRAGFGMAGAKARVRFLIDRIEGQARIDRALAYLNRGEPVPPDLRTAYVLSTYMLAAYRYQAPTWSGKLDIVRSRQFARQTPDDGWDRCGAEIERTVVEGDHRSIVRTEEGIEPIANWIRRLLEGISAARPKDSRRNGYRQPAGPKVAHAQQTAP